MRDVIQKVIATEAEAKQLVKSAQAEADKLLAAARIRARDLVEQARQQTRAEAAKILVEAEEQARREKADRLSLAAAEISAGVQLNEIKARQAVAAALRCVCGLGEKTEIRL